MASNKEYLVDLLREDMGFEGMLVTDYNEVRVFRILIDACIFIYID